MTMMKRTLILVACLVLLVAAVGVARADGEITVVRDAVTAAFQQQITFTLEAQGSAGDITKVTLYYQQGNQPVTAYAYPQFDPGRSVTAKYVWDTKKSYVPPGITITYYYQLEDAQGHQLKTAPKTFLYTDDRHTWQTRTGGKLSLSWYQGTDAFGQGLFDAATTALAQLERDASVTVQQPISIWIYASYDELRNSMEQGAKEWTGGVSYSEMGVILIGVPVSSLDWGKRAVAHELSHVVLDQATHNPYGDLPQWLNEGLAMYAEGPLETSYSAPLAQAASQGKLISIKSISGNFPTDSAAANLSYAESYSIVKYLLDTYGRDKMAALLQTFKGGSTYDAALKKVYGMNTQELDTTWQATLGAKQQAATPSPSSPPGGDTTAVLALTIVGCGCLTVAALTLAVILYLARRRKR
jgi:hypothetical protein